MVHQPHPERTAAAPRRGRGHPSPAAADALRFGGRYEDLRDDRLANTLVREDAAVEREELSPHERLSCHVHRRWAHECISSPAHVIAVTGHRWCRSCEAEASVAVDEVSGAVSVVCTRCRTTPDSAATRQILRTCRASLAVVLDGRRACAAQQVRAA
ncbi:hypothetical protein [Saccharopolyspora shandongensis]|uniref:hypothetical protein n=1 Tax=Saccharopolyspora shandongensis TaxID=418495 RepID=UPI0033C0D212